MKNISNKLSSIVLLTACLGSFSNSASAVDGVVLITQANAQAGNVTPGDTAGFPVTITRSGSYRLAGNLTVPNLEQRAIQINIRDVTFDLNGFQISGPGNCDPGGGGDCTKYNGDGINSVGLSTITNGNIRGMGGHGIACASTCRIEGVSVIGNNGDGINAVNLSLITGNIAVGNGGFGLNLGETTGLINNICDNNLLGGVSGGTSMGGNVCPDPVR